MTIDFNHLEEVKIDGFKGGKGELCMRSFADEKCRIMHGVLRPGASSGLHCHSENSEILYVLSGIATFYCDGEQKIVCQGQVHYCPMGHSHYMENNETEDLVYLAIVPEHH